MTLILTEENFSVSGVRRIAEIPNRSTLPLYLYRNETAAARVEFVTSWEVADSDTHALQAMLHSDYDPRKHVILQTPESTLFEWPLKTSKIENTLPPLAECHGSVQIKKITATTHSASFAVSNSCDGSLVFSEPFYPGWRVYVDSKPTPVFRANYAFSAILLPAGEHQVERFYRPNSLLFGGISSLLFCGLLGVVMYKYKGFPSVPNTSP